jgi:hypothetical protein
MRRMSDPFWSANLFSRPRLTESGAMRLFKPGASRADNHPRARDRETKHCVAPGHVEGATGSRCVPWLTNMRRGENHVGIPL